MDAVGDRHGRNWVRVAAVAFVCVVIVGAVATMAHRSHTRPHVSTELDVQPGLAIREPLVIGNGISDAANRTVTDDLTRRLLAGVNARGEAQRPGRLPSVQRLESTPDFRLRHGDSDPSTLTAVLEAIAVLLIMLTIAAVGAVVLHFASARFNRD